jgi:hypothetical protein
MLRRVGAGTSFNFARINIGLLANVAGHGGLQCCSAFTAVLLFV